MSFVANTGNGWRYITRNTQSTYTEPGPRTPNVPHQASWNFSASTKCGECGELKCSGNLEFYTEPPPRGFRDPEQNWPNYTNQTNLRLRLSFEYEADSTTILSSDVNNFEKRQSHNMDPRFGRRPPSPPDRQDPIAPVGQDPPSLCLE